MSPAKILRAVLAGGLGAAAALLVACGGGANLIPAGTAGPLTNDFNTVATDVANGNCSGVSSALTQAQHDLDGLPATVDARLRRRLEEGLVSLRQTAPTQCAQNKTSSQTTAPPTTTVPPTTTTAPPTTTTAPPTTTTSAPPTTTTPPPTTTTPVPTTTTPVPNTGGGTPGPSGNGAGAGAGGSPPGSG